MYIYIYIYTNLPVSDIVGLPHPRSGDSQGQETFYIYIYIYICIHLQTSTQDTNVQYKTRKINVVW